MTGRDRRVAIITGTGHGIGTGTGIGIGTGAVYVQFDEGSPGGGPALRRSPEKRFAAGRAPAGRLAEAPYTTRRTRKSSISAAE